MVEPSLFFLCDTGCWFGCICSLFASNRFASLIGAEFDTAVTVPDFPVIDDSWRQSLWVSSADSSFASDTDDSHHQLSNSGLSLDESVTDAVAAGSSVYLTSTGCSGTVSSEASLSSLQCRGADKKQRGKRTAAARRVSNFDDNSAASPSVWIPHKRRRLKRNLSQTLPSVGDDQVERGASVSQNSKHNLSSDNAELTRTSSETRRRSKCSRTHADSGGDDRTAQKRRRRSTTDKTSMLSARKKMREDGTVTSTRRRAQAGKARRVKDVTLDNTQTADGTTRLSDSALVTPRHAQLQLRSLTTGECYVLQPVAKVKF